ncbi:ATP-dependent nuclease [Streptomyces mirabilis]|uniref:ATP-dependent nuclease n=1 Tax=Streptomyces mirabilis TaxID=68239 RepID=UPI0034084739
MASTSITNRHTHVAERTMRISAVDIRNFKGLARATLEDVGNESVIMISGRNGTGKSLFLQALAQVWSKFWNPQEQVGPWGDSCEISISLRLTEYEFEKIKSWHARSGAPEPQHSNEYRAKWKIDRLNSSVGQEEFEPVIDTLQSSQFQLEHPFARMDYLPALRLLPSSATPAVSLSMLSRESSEDERRQMLNQATGAGASPVNLPDISNYLATLDYQRYLAERQEIPLNNEYELITATFMEATGKTIQLPTFDPDSGQSGIYVATSTGMTHSIDKLSSGEKGLLGLMYFVRRLSASGGVLLLDEPELHLHPTLQAALFESMRGLADRAQVISVSHSVNLISTAPSSGMVQLNPPTGPDENQAERLRDNSEKTRLMSILGISPADILQSDALLVVEGDSDHNWLRTLFPVELGRLHVLESGGGKQVLSTHRTLENMPLGIPWLCLLDRDFYTDKEIEQLEDSYPNLYIWRRREIESYFLESELIHSLLHLLGRTETLEAVTNSVISSVDPLREDVLEALTDRELSRQFPSPGKASQGSRFDKMKWQYAEYAKVNEARADKLSEVVEAQREILNDRWPTVWQTMVDPKAALAKINGGLRIMGSPDALKTALAARIRDSVEDRPEELEAFRLRLLKMLT